MSAQGAGLGNLMKGELKGDGRHLDYYLHGAEESHEGRIERAMTSAIAFGIEIAESHEGRIESYRRSSP